MINESDCALGSRFKGRFVAKNSNMTLMWRKRVWIYNKMMRRADSANVLVYLRYRDNYSDIL